MRSEGKDVLPVCAEYDERLPKFASEVDRLHSALPSRPSDGEIREHRARLDEKVEDDVVDDKDTEPASTAVEDELDQLERRYGKLLDRVERRKVQLDEAMKSHVGYKSALETLVPWLEEQEVKMEIDEPVMAEPEAVMEEIEKVEVDYNIRYLCIRL